MSTQKKNTRRKALAVGLAVLGVAGLSLASAAQLQLNTSNGALVQAGVEDLSASGCQVGPVNVSIETTGGGSLALGSGFGYQDGDYALDLTGIEAACAGKNMKVALGTSTGTSLGETTVLAAEDQTIALATGFGSAVDPEEVAKVSVTIY